MRINEWVKRLENLETKVKEGLIPEQFKYEMHPSMTKVEVEFGLNGKIVRVDGTSVGYRIAKEFDGLFRGNQRVFEALINKAEREIEMAVNSTNQIILAAIEEAVPDLVARRMRGEQVNDTPREVLNEQVKTVLKTLHPSTIYQNTMVFAKHGDINLSVQDDHVVIGDVWLNYNELCGESLQAKLLVISRTKDIKRRLKNWEADYRAFCVRWAEKPLDELGGGGDETDS